MESILEVRHPVPMNVNSLVCTGSLLKPMGWFLPVMGGLLSLRSALISGNKVQCLRVICCFMGSRCKWALWPGLFCCHLGAARPSLGFEERRLIKAAILPPSAYLSWSKCVHFGVLHVLLFEWFCIALDCGQTSRAANLSGTTHREHVSRGPFGFRLFEVWFSYLSRFFTFCDIPQYGTTSTACSTSFPIGLEHH